MDNYYTSPELFEELYFREASACGIVRMNRKSMPSITLKHVNVKPLESAFLRNGLLLCLKWKGAKSKTKNKPVTVLSTIHDANDILTTKKDSHSNRIPKPETVYEYTNNMSTVDLSDQYMASHMSLRKSMKLWRKLSFPILNKKYSNNKLSHDDYMHHIADYLIAPSMEDCTCLNQRTIRPNPMKMRLLEKHFICKIPQNPTCKTT